MAQRERAQALWRAGGSIVAGTDCLRLLKYTHTNTHSLFTQTHTHCLRPLKSLTD